MGGVRKFQKMAMAAMKPDLLSLMTGGGSESKAFQEAMKNHLFDLPGPRYANLSPTGRKKYIVTIFRGFSEITTSLQALDDIQFMVGRFPFRGKRISGERYLQLHVEAFLAETYLLSVRLEKYLTMLRRQYKGDSREREIGVHARALRKVVHDSLKSVLAIRHSHTHEERFKDDGISRLGTISMLINDGDRRFQKLMKGFYREQHSKEKRRWKEVMAENNREIRRLLDYFFEDLRRILFDLKTGSPKFPDKLRQ